MNPFVNLKKRSVQLPDGAKDLIDVLRPRRGRRRPKCQYCGAPAMELHILGTVDDRWCEECIRDLRQFAAQLDYHFDFDPDDKEAVARFQEDLQRRQDEFMQQRLKARKAQ
jgi:hypothetical protein